MRFCHRHANSPYSQPLNPWPRIPQHFSLQFGKCDLSVTSLPVFSTDTISLNHGARQRWSVRCSMFSNGMSGVNQIVLVKETTTARAGARPITQPRKQKLFETNWHLI